MPLTRDISIVIDLYISS